MTPRLRSKPSPRPSSGPPPGMREFDFYPVVYLAAHDEQLHGSAAQLRRQGLIRSAALACGRNPAGFDLRFVQQTPPHHAFRNGFPEYRLCLAHAPSLVLGAPGVDVSPFARVGIPAANWTPEQPLAPDLVEWSREKEWKRPLVTGSAAKAVASCERVALYDPGVPRHPDDGPGTVVVALSPFGLDVEHPPDFFVVEASAFDLPLAAVEAEGTIVEPRPEDHRLTGVLSIPMRLDAPGQYRRAMVQYTTCVRPVPNIVAPSLIYGVYPIFPGKLGPMQSVMAAAVCGFRRSGFGGPIIYRARPTRGPVQPHDAMEPVSLQQEFGPFEYAGGTSEATLHSRSVAVRFDLRDIDLRFGVNPILDWLIRHRGHTDADRAATHVHGPKWLVEYLDAHGFATEAPPGEAAVYVVRPARMQPD